MKWKRNVPRRDCRRQPLTELIRDELTPEQCARLESHLSQCEVCQQRLTKLTADNQWWLDASRWLDPAAADGNSLDGALDGESISCCRNQPATGCRMPTACALAACNCWRRERSPKKVLT